ncbi:unnamed protein product [Prunus brigantina]
MKHAAHQIGKLHLKEMEIAIHEESSSTTVSVLIMKIASLLFHGKSHEPLDISFSSTLRGKVLTIPPIHIDDHRGTSFRNLLALNMSPALPPRCYKLFVFLDDVINSSKDVGLLYYHGVLLHSLGSNRMVAKLVNKRQGSWAGRVPVILVQAILALYLALIQTGCGVAGARRDLGHKFSFISFLKDSLFITYVHVEKILGSSKAMESDALHDMDCSHGLKEMIEFMF